MPITTSIESFDNEYANNKSLLQNFDLEQIINQSNSVVYVRKNDAKWSVKYLSTGISRLGYVADQFMSNEIFFTDIIESVDLARINFELNNAIEQNKMELRLEYRLISKSKDIVWVSDFLQFIKDIEKNIVEIQGVIIDITEQKENEQKVTSLARIVRLRNDALNKANQKLKKSYDEIQKIHNRLTESENKLRTKLDFILSPDTPLGDFSITDIFDLDQLQKLQDAFAISHNVASLITDINGIPITQPSNFTEVCQLVRSSIKGMELCQLSDKLVGQKAREQLRPFSINCLSCGFLDAGAPIIVAGKHIANWMIGQAVKSKDDDYRLKELAIKINVSEERLKEAFSKVRVTDCEYFNKVVDFLWLMAKEISALGYNNLKQARDIEERKKMEIALRESEELYRQLVQTSPDGIALVSSEGKMLYVSPKAKQLFGYPLDFDTKGLSIFDFIEKNCLEEAISNVTEVFTKNTHQSGIYTMVRMDKSTFIAEVNSAPISDYQGNIKAMISILRDITERKKVEEDLINAKNKAEESDRLKSAFLANMSHEIRTPMNAILGFAGLIAEDNFDMAQRREYAEIIHQNGNVLLKLIDDILDVAKMEAGQLKITESPCHLDHLLHDLYLVFQTQIEHSERKNLNLFLNLPKPVLDFQVLVDKARLSQVISNLLSNALKFTEKGLIEFGYSGDSSKLVFYVKDTGIGLSAESTKVIFDRFRQVDQSMVRAHGGTGLGLAICKNLITLMGGEIWVESEQNSGAIFSFTIPFKPCRQDEMEFTPQITADKLVNFNWKHKNVLIAEDEQANFYYLSELLKPTNVNILYAKDGKEAIHIVKNNKNIDLVLMDIKMPDVNGFNATREIKKMNQNIPVIAQTAYAMEEDVLLCKQAGCDDYISKPIDHYKLLHMINFFFVR